VNPNAWFALPALLLLLFFVAYPMFELVRMSISDVNPGTLLRDWPFVGFDNFSTLFQDPRFLATVIRTVVFGLVVLVIGVIGGLIAALALNRPSRFGAFTYALIVLMWALPPIVSGVTWKFMLAGDGIINQLLLASGVVPEPILFLIDGAMPLISVAFVAGWVALPFAAIVFRASLMDVPREYYEAAQVDGAGVVAQFRYITLPSIAPTIYVVSILLLSYAVRSFDFTFAMTGGGPGDASTTLPVFGYLTAFTGFNYSEGAAIAVLTVGAVLLFALPYARSIRRR
jgi:ABC-type sugar transport system permease subunit